VVGSVDNVLRPRLVGQDTRMHELLIFFSTLGGLMFFGAMGFILGPILAALWSPASICDLDNPVECVSPSTSGSQGRPCSSVVRHLHCSSALMQKGPHRVGPPPF
jgi:AI-2E family transporter